jgi:ABC-type glutathione transport system ATPase component
MSIKSFITEKLIRAKMKHLPKAQQDMFIKLINENPELFKQIADETKALTKGGMSEMTATMQVMRKHQAEIQRLMTQ